MEGFTGRPDAQAAPVGPSAAPFRVWHKRQRRLFDAHAFDPEAKSTWDFFNYSFFPTKRIFEQLSDELQLNCVQSSFFQRKILSLGIFQPSEALLQINTETEGTHDSWKRVEGLEAAEDSRSHDSRLPAAELDTWRTHGRIHARDF